MGTSSLSHWLVVLAVVLILFGAGRIPSAMGDLARGIRAFRTGMKPMARARLVTAGAQHARAELRGRSCRPRLD